MFRWFKRTHQLLEEILAKLAHLTQEITMATLQLQRLTAAVAAEKTIVEGAVTLLNGIPDLIRNAGAGGVADQAALDDLARQIEVENSALRAAIVANTPDAHPAADSTPEAPPAPPPEPTPSVSGEGTPATE